MTALLVTITTDGMTLLFVATLAVVLMTLIYALGSFAQQEGWGSLDAVVLLLGASALLLCLLFGVGIIFGGGPGVRIA
jgi:hypothetical protein